MKQILTIAGSDSSGGAGIQGDLKTFSAHGVHGLSVITAITAQNTVEILSIEPVNNISDQLKALEEDIPIHGIKIGMVYSENSVLAVADFIKHLKIPIVLDPLMYSSTGKSLLTEKALIAIKQNLISYVNLITPNTAEASYLAEIDILTCEDREKACKKIYKQYGIPVLLKGGHDGGSKAIDILWDGSELEYYKTERINAVNTHGTGCCLSSAIVCGLANGLPLKQAIQEGKQFVIEAISHGYSIGKGEGPIDPLLHRLKI